MEREKSLDLVFDLDGTLIDSAPDLHACLNRLLGADGRRRLDLAEVVAMVGDGVPALVRRAYRATGGIPGDIEDRIAHYRAIYGDSLTDRTVAYPGVAETLARLFDAGYRMAVCTNKPHAPTMAILDALGLAGFFKSVAGGDSLPVRKPDPGHLLGLLKMLGSGPERAVMIGDSRNDIQVAINAGVRSIAVSYGYRREPVEELGANVIIDSFAEIPEALERLD
ncbi:MAG: phosphoglycolate phosphatase [Alphaproteobacteria bacterium]|nr:phosphoglycolate phosphatase [Alphaproteobacteria bacterium]